MKKNGQGTGTVWKEDAFLACLRMVAQARRGEKSPWYYGDAYAGPGYNADVGAPGSPLVALEVFRRAHGAGQTWAWFGDADRRACDLLDARLSGNGRRVAVKGWRIWHLPAVLFVPEFASEIARQERAAGRQPRNAAGMLLLDPSGADLPLTQVEQFSLKFPRMDIVVNLNIQYLDKAWGARRAGYHGWQERDKLLTNPARLPRRWHRREWWACWRQTRQSRFLTLYLTNTPRQPWGQELGWQRAFPLGPFDMEVDPGDRPARPIVGM